MELNRSMRRRSKKKTPESKPASQIKTCKELIKLSMIVFGTATPPSHCAVSWASVRLRLLSCDSRTPSAGTTNFDSGKAVGNLLGGKAWRSHSAELQNLIFSRWPQTLQTFLQTIEDQKIESQNIDGVLETPSSTLTGCSASGVPLTALWAVPRSGRE